MCAFLCLVAKVNDRFLEKRINIEFCMKLEKNASDIYALIFEAYQRETMERSRVCN